MIVKQELKTTAEMAAWYDETFTRMGGVWHTSPEEWETHLDRAGVTGGTLLDVGAGDGSFMEAAQKRGCIVSGIDISHVAVGWALAKSLTVLPLSIETSPLTGAYDWIFSLGSLEHVIDLDKALDNIHALLKSDGKWYFYLPSEKWIHEDQPNERTGTAIEWATLFRKHGLNTTNGAEIGDCVAIWGDKDV